MAESTIITGQFVRIRQSPASVGERFVAWIVDFLVIIAYVYIVSKIIRSFLPPSDASLMLHIFLLVIPMLLYSFLCELLNHGQSPGKRLLRIRVVKADGSTPTLGGYLLRWLLLPVDFFMGGCVGLCSILLTNNHQRLGDLAAGTMVIREKDYHKIHVSLDEFDYLSHNYHPAYPQAADLSLEQINVITGILQSEQKYRTIYIDQLAAKVRKTLSITPREENNEQFLRTLLRDYQYYALEEL